MKRYKKGDVVRVKYFNKFPNHWIFSMGELMSKEVTIRYCDYMRKRYFVNMGVFEAPWFFKDTDFEEVDFLSDKDLLI